MTLGIEAAGLRLGYGDVTALGDLSFTLPGGRIYGLLGRNGSGKTPCCRSWPGSARRRAARC